MSVTGCASLKDCLFSQHTIMCLYVHAHTQCPHGSMHSVIQIRQAMPQLLRAANRTIMFFVPPSSFIWCLVQACHHRIKYCPLHVSWKQMFRGHSQKNRLIWCGHHCSPHNGHLGTGIWLMVGRGGFQPGQWRNDSPARVPVPSSGFKFEWSE